MKTYSLECAISAINDGITLVQVSGEIDLYNSGTLREHFKRLRRQGVGRLIFDFSNTLYMDSSGVGVVVHIFSSCEQRNIQVRFSNFRNPVYRLLKMTRLDGILPITDTVTQAIDEILESRNFNRITVRKIEVDGDHPLFDISGMSHLKIKLILKQVRRFSLLIVQKAPPEIRETNLLEQQICELIKNAVKHGNKNNPEKSVEIWYAFESSKAHIVIKDEGEGFTGLEEWNDFYAKRMKFHHEQNYAAELSYLSFKTANSDESDGGNALFAAVEYWNNGIVFNNNKNAVAVKRIFLQ